VGLFDPSNHAVKPELLYRASEVHFPGPGYPFLGDGAARMAKSIIIFTKSGVVGDDRRLLRYTPPVTTLAETNLSRPVPAARFSDDASAWTAVGRANVILDNLIGKAKPRP